MTDYVGLTFHEIGSVDVMGVPVRLYVGQFDDGKWHVIARNDAGTICATDILTDSRESAELIAKYGNFTISNTIAQIIATQPNALHTDKVPG